MKAPELVESDGAMTSALESALTDLSAAYERLDGVGGARELALRRADLGALAASVTEESEALRVVAEIEARRAPVVAFFAVRFGAASPEGITAGWIAERLDEPARGRIIAIADRLRTMIERCHRRNESTCLAAETLARHMQGLLRGAERELSHAGTYGRRGMVEAGPRVLSAMDVTS